MQYSVLFSEGFLSSLGIVKFTGLLLCVQLLPLSHFC